MKKCTVFLFPLFFLYLLICPQEALSSAREGLLLWYHSVLPALFPFMILCTATLRLGILDQALLHLYKPFHFVFGCSPYGDFAILTGFLCGFPMGAKITSDLKDQGKISDSEALWLMGFVNNLSPAFLLSYLAYDQMQQPNIRWLFLGNILGSSLLYGLVSSRRALPPAASLPGTASHLKHQMTFHVHDASSRQMTFHNHGTSSQQSTFISRTPTDKFANSAPASNSSDTANTSGFFDIIDDCISSSVSNIVRLGVYIMLFSILNGALAVLLPMETLPALLLRASIEVTGGIRLLAQASLPLNLRFLLVNALCTFGGFCALAQSLGLARMDRKTFFYYIKSRVSATLLSILLSCFSIILGILLN